MGDINKIQISIIVYSTALMVSMALGIKFDTSFIPAFTASIGYVILINTITEIIKKK